jgi:hypothetical protein
MLFCWVLSGQPFMTIFPTRDELLMSSYFLVRRSGLLETSVGRRLFRSVYFLYKRYIEDDLQELVRSRPDLLQGGNVLDVGANIGYIATVLAQTIDPAYRVYAFEPEPFNYGILQRTAAQPSSGTKSSPCNARWAPKTAPSNSGSICAITQTTG